MVIGSEFQRTFPLAVAQVAIKSANQALFERKSVVELASFLIIVHLFVLLLII